jgi:hypothetical protein
MKTRKTFWVLGEKKSNKLALMAAVIAFGAATCVLQANAAPPEFAGPKPVNPVQTDRMIDFQVAQDPLIAGGIFFQVPAGFMFMAQQASVSLSLPFGQTPVSARIVGGLQSFGPGGAGLYIPLELQGSFGSGSQDNFAGAEDIHWYFPPGENVAWEVFRTDPANPGLGKGRISISGVLLECDKEIICPSP